MQRTIVKILSPETAAKVPERFPFQQQFLSGAHLFEVHSPGRGPSAATAPCTSVPRCSAALSLQAREVAKLGSPKPDPRTV
ncbi:MAG: hypothetical protein JXA18_15625, partial [Chitinispirillaceae bacterium]|nr:hypothetical protein [Chitinispirillaceae bacterium]